MKILFLVLFILTLVVMGYCLYTQNLAGVVAFGFMLVSVIMLEQGAK